jgi:uncharacterized protein YaaR (DUF327 family)
MAEIDTVFPAQYYAGVLEQQRRLSQEKKQGTRSVPAHKSGFQELLEKQSPAMESSGDIPEIMRLSDDEALVFLKDALDNAADNLKAGVSTEYFMVYKAAVTNFMKFVVKRNYELGSSKRKWRSRKWDDDSYHVIRVIDEKLDRLAAEVLTNQKDKLSLLAKIDEINGLLVDLLS